MTVIRHAAIEEKQKTYEWLCLSDTAGMHMGPPDYPESPVPTRGQFEEDFEDFYYLENGRNRGSVMIIENDGEEIGCLCYACFHLKPYRAELDIWLKARAYCGKGYGTRAIGMLIDYLGAERGITGFIIRPSEKNTRAIASYRKAGFVSAPDRVAAVHDFLLSEFLTTYGDGDYGAENTAVLTRVLN